MIGRRGLMAGAATLVGGAPAIVRLGILQFGTVQWVADVIRRHDLDTRHGFSLRGTLLANTDAGRISLMAGASDVILSDWPFVTAQRAAGSKLCFAGFSSASGGVVTAQDSPIRDLADLAGRKLGVAGGPADKSWLVVRAAGKARDGVDLAASARCVYGAPPLLGAKLRQGELDAVLTYWNFVAMLQADGFRQAVSVADCVNALGVSSRISMVGFVFHQDWADANRAAIDGFLAAVGDAERKLAGSRAEWDAVRPLMRADNDALFGRLRDGFVAGMSRADAAEQARGAARLLVVLRRTGGAAATGGVETLPPGVFWPDTDGTG
ncbi:ABC transporter substrate-binding protein [Rhodopila sp.]|uniref:ABC transporter substrate-binding protein n=1 Tax=Rhodopila sp. TaxID=2480087 RepID=UPI003D0A7D6D